MTKEIPYKEWLYRMADILGISPKSVEMRVYRGKLKTPPIRRKNARVFYVQVEE